MGKRTVDEEITPLDEAKINYYFKLKEQGHESPGTATAKFFETSPQEISRVKAKYERIRDRKQVILMDEFSQFSEALQEFKASTIVRNEMMKKLQNNIERLDERESKMKEVLTNLEIIVDSMYADPEDDKTNFEILKKIKKILIGRNSPLHFVSVLAEERKQIATMDRIMNSSTTTLEKLVRTQQMIMELNPDDLPLERQKELLRWYIKAECSICPGNPYRKDDIERRTKEKKKQERISQTIKDGPVVDV